MSEAIVIFSTMLYVTGVILVVMSFMGAIETSPIVGLCCMWVGTLIEFTQIFLILISAVFVYYYLSIRYLRVVPRGTPEAALIFVTELDRAIPVDDLPEDHSELLSMMKMHYTSGNIEDKHILILINRVVATSEITKLQFEILCNYFNLEVSS